MTSPTALATREQHELALLLSGRCRRCAERIPGGTALRGLPCPSCAERTLPSDTDRTLLHGLHTSRSATRLWVAVALVGVAALVAGVFPVLNSLLLAGALLWVRFTIVSPALRLLTPHRRLISRWTLRLASGCFLAASVVLLEALTLLPALGIIAKSFLSAVDVALAGVASRGYLSWQLGREGRGVPVGSWEVSLLAAWGLLLLALVALCVAAMLWVLAKLDELEHFLMELMPRVTL